MRIVQASVARAAIAGRMLGTAAAAELGDIRLLPHQRDAVRRITRMLHEHRGALLADDVGVGKTFVALAVARSEPDVLLVAPAAVRDHWLASAARAAMRMRVLSMEQLSRRPQTDGAPLVIVDEAHHLRNRHTRRFRHAADLCRGARVLLLSATPVQNSVDDLRALLSLFLGERAYGLAEDQLATYMVRRTGAALPTPRPTVGSVTWLPPVQDADCLNRLMDLPPAVTPTDGGDAGTLVVWSLVRLWASSRAALRTALRRRMARGLAMQDAMQAGRMPTRRELAAWVCADNTQQLAFPELMVEQRTTYQAELLSQLDVHLTALRQLLAWLDTTPDPDGSRADALRACTESGPTRRVVAFTEFAETARSLYRLLAPRGAVALLTHGGAVTAGGRLSRRELIARFAAGASSRIAPRDRVDLLVTTDVLSEGVNLPDANTVVHLDLTWNPARLAQRVGRLLRMDSPHRRVRVYAMPPPAPAERLLQVERRLRRKHAVAEHLLGTGAVLLPESTGSSGRSPAEVEEGVSRLLDQWFTDIHVRGGVVGAVRSDGAGALVCVTARGVPTLLALDADALSDDRVAVEAMMRRTHAPDAPVSADALRDVLARVDHWVTQRRVTEMVSTPSLRVAGARRALLRRLDRISSDLPRSARARMAPLLRHARAVVAGTLSAGTEHALAQLSRTPMDDTNWVQQVIRVATPGRDSPPAADDGRVIAVILLTP